MDLNKFVTFYDRAELRPPTWGGEGLERSAWHRVDVPFPADEPQFRMQEIQQGKKKRVISVPNDAMRTVHQNFLAHLRERAQYWPGRVLLDFSTCGEEGDSPFDNVRRHLGKRYFYQTDIRAAYDSVKPELLARALLHVDRELGLPEGKLEAESMMEQFDQMEDLLVFLRRYFLTEAGGLRTGGPASPLLFNLFAGLHLDQPIRELIIAHSEPKEAELMRGGHIISADPTYTRYMDDLTISSKNPIPETLRAGVRRAIEAAGLQISHHKTTMRTLDKGPVVVTGVGLTGEGRIFVPRKTANRVRGLMHALMHGRPAQENAVAQVHGLMGSIIYLHRYARAVQSLYGQTMPHRNKTEEKLFKLYRYFRRQMRRRNARQNQES